jgi:hypothetical protein
MGCKLRRDEPPGPTHAEHPTLFNLKVVHQRYIRGVLQVQHLRRGLAYWNIAKVQDPTAHLKHRANSSSQKAQDRPVATWGSQRKVLAAEGSRV